MQKVNGRAAFSEPRGQAVTPTCLTQSPIAHRCAAAVLVTWNKFSKSQCEMCARHEYHHASRYRDLRILQASYSVSIGLGSAEGLQQLWQFQFWSSCGSGSFAECRTTLPENDTNGYLRLRSQELGGGFVIRRIMIWTNLDDFWRVLLPSVVKSGAWVQHMNE
jgi:hypothetical protein